MRNFVVFKENVNEPVIARPKENDLTLGEVIEEAYPDYCYVSFFYGTKSPLRSSSNFEGLKELLDQRKRQGYKGVFLIIPRTPYSETLLNLCEEVKVGSIIDDFLKGTDKVLAPPLYEVIKIKKEDENKPLTTDQTLLIFKLRSIPRKTLYGNAISQEAYICHEQGVFFKLVNELLEMHHDSNKIMEDIVGVELINELKSYIRPWQTTL